MCCHLFSLTVVIFKMMVLVMHPHSLNSAWFDSYDDCQYVNECMVIYCVLEYPLTFSFIYFSFSANACCLVPSIMNSAYGECSQGMCCIHASLM